MQIDFEYCFKNWSTVVEISCPLNRVYSAKYCKQCLKCLKDVNTLQYTRYYVNSNQMATDNADPN